MKKLILLLLVLSLLPCCVPGKSEDDYVCAQPGDSGGDVRVVLEAAFNLGLLKELPEDEEEYREEYIPAVRDLEKTLSLEPDGIVHLSEIECMEGLIYPGSEGKDVKNLLEILANLGYIKNLPEEHSVYDKKYVNSVKSAEKKLSLTPDGYLTAAEQKALKAVPRITPDAIATLKIVSKNGQAVLSWSASKNAVTYTVRRGGKVVATVKGTSWTDKDVNMAEYYNYSVV